MLCGGSDAAIIPIGIIYAFLILDVSMLIIFTNLSFFCDDLIAGLGGFVACRALSQRNSDPAKASRPWDIVLFQTFSLLLGQPFSYVMKCANLGSTT